MGQNCPNCYPKISLNETRVFCEFKLIFNDVVKKRMSRYELDVFIPSINLGVEYDGRYYHKDIARDIIKINIFDNMELKLLEFVKIYFPK